MNRPCSEVRRANVIVIIRSMHPMIVVIFTSKNRQRKFSLFFYYLQIANLVSTTSSLFNWLILPFNTFRPRIPADPVSIAIAVRASQRTYVPEGQLEYGFKKRPIDAVRRKVFRNIPEEKLHSLHNKVIEFKKPNDSEEDEFRIDDSDEDDSPCARPNSEYQSDTSCLAYSDIGYCPTKTCDRKFKNVPCSTPNPCRLPPLVESECTGRIIDIPEKTEDERCEEYLHEYISNHAPRELMSR